MELPLYTQKNDKGYFINYYDTLEKLCLNSMQNVYMDF